MGGAVRAWETVLWQTKMRAYLLQRAWETPYWLKRRCSTPAFLAAGGGRRLCCRILVSNQGSMLHLLKQKRRRQNLQVGGQMTHCVLHLTFNPAIQGVCLLLVRGVRGWRKHSVTACEIGPQKADEQAASALLLGQSSPRTSLLKTFCMEDTALLLSFDDPLRHVRLVSGDLVVPRTVCDKFRPPSFSSACRSIRLASCPDGPFSPRLSSGHVEGALRTPPILPLSIDEVALPSPRLPPPHQRPGFSSGSPPISSLKPILPLPRL
ncbi:hypothetical protein CRENBAI_020218 [Crenichthys baileyi]|uniref:Uncharacterized protein n=1 Tax=Crenichthys baileyi TaxID=28760 RepID=A0AAV9SAK4_9TELE